MLKKINYFDSGMGKQKRTKPKRALSGLARSKKGNTTNGLFSKPKYHSEINLTIDDVKHQLQREYCGKKLQYPMHALAVIMPSFRAIAIKKIEQGLKDKQGHEDVKAADKEIDRINILLKEKNIWLKVLCKRRDRYKRKVRYAEALKETRERIRDLKSEIRTHEKEIRDLLAFQKRRWKRYQFYLDTMAYVELKEKEEDVKYQIGGPRKR